MKSKIKKIVRRCIFRVHQIKQEQFYHYVMKLNNIPDKESDGEKAWLEKWSVFGLKAKPSQYRVFRHYIGDDINIVPEDICHDFIEPVLNPSAYTGYYSDKNVFDRLFPAGYLPKTILRSTFGEISDANYCRVELNDKELCNKLNECIKKIIIKPTVDGMSGVGVQLFVKQDNGKWINPQNGKLLNVQYIKNKCGNNWIIQEAVEQYEYINQFNDSSVNTLRLSLYRSVKDEECHITGAIMRIGGKGSVVDNAHAGGCYVGIREDGTFCHEVYDQYGVKRTIFNDIDFSNDYMYPNWNEVIAFAQSIAQYVPHHRLLALDIVLTKEGKPQLIEFNILYYSSWLFQYTTGAAFGIFTDEILEYCKNNQHNVCYNISI